MKEGDVVLPMSDDLTGDEKDMLDKGVAAMKANKQAVIVSQTRLKKMNLRIGQRIKLYGLNYPDMEFDLEIIGSLPDGKYEGVGFMNKEYLDNLLKTMPPDYIMQGKVINLIWVRLPTKQAFEYLNELVDPTDPRSERQDIRYAKLKPSDEEIRQRKVLAQDRFKEHSRFGLHRVAQFRPPRREFLRVGFDDIQVTRFQPLPGKIVGQRG